MYSDFNLPIETWSSLTRSSECMLYPGCLPWTSVRARNRQEQIPLSPAKWRALARTYYAAGADGLSIFNHFCAAWVAPFYPQQMHVFHDLRDADRISAGERHYVFDPMWTGMTGFGSDGRSSTGRVNANASRLARSGPERESTYEFRLYEDLTRAHGASLLFRGFGMCEDDEIAVSLNGHLVADEFIGRTRQTSAPPAEWDHMRKTGDAQIKCLKEQARIEFRPEAQQDPAFSTRWFALDDSLVRQGINELSVRLIRSDPAATGTIVIDEVEIHVTPRS